MGSDAIFHPDPIRTWQPPGVRQELPRFGGGVLPGPKVDDEQSQIEERVGWLHFVQQEAVRQRLLVDRQRDGLTHPHVIQDWMRARWVTLLRTAGAAGVQ